MKKCRTMKDLQNCPWLVGRPGAKVDEEPNEEFNYSACLIAGRRTSDNDQHIIHAMSVKELCDEVNFSREWLDDPDLPEDQRRVPGVDKSADKLVLCSDKETGDFDKRLVVKETTNTFFLKKSDSGSWNLHMADGLFLEEFTRISEAKAFVASL